MTEEARKEGAQELPYRAASPEFFFLLQRIDRLDEKLTAEIASLRQEVRAMEAGLRQELKAVEAGLRQELKAVEVGLRQELKGTLRWVIGLVLTTLGLVVAVALKVWV